MDVFNPDFDLKQSLAEDNSGTVLKVALDALREGDQTVRNAMDRGLAPAAFQSAAALKTALALAEESLAGYWKMQHPQA